MKRGQQNLLLYAATAIPWVAFAGVVVWMLTRKQAPSAPAPTAYVPPSGGPPAIAPPDQAIRSLVNTYLGPSQAAPPGTVVRPGQPVMQEPWPGAGYLVPVYQ